MTMGCTRCSSAWAAAWSPEAMTSSSLRRFERMLERRILLTAVRAAILRTAFLADGVLAMERLSVWVAPIPDGSRTKRAAPNRNRALPVL